MDPLDDQDVLAHYRGVAQTVVRHLAGRPVVSAGWSESGPGRVGSIEELLDAVGQGCRWFAVPVDPLAARSFLHLAPGPGADISTVATVALALLESAADGVPGLVLTDGGDGMFVVTGPREQARAQIEALAERAPEIATIDPAQDDGRVLIRLTLPGAPVPVPYSLVDSTDGTGVVLPLHADEVAAATAGMPMDHGPEDAALRLGARGDLAAALNSPAGGPA